MSRPPKIAIAGVSGYAGGELARLLLRHPGMEGTAPMFLGRAGESGDAVNTLESLHPNLVGIGTDAIHPIQPFHWDRLADAGTEILFLALPHEQSREWAPEAIARGMRVIDLSGAWRLQDEQNRAVYKLHDADPEAAARLQEEAVYGNPELYRDAIRAARLVANPGCYSTSAILALAPLVRAGVVDLETGIICDAKSGVSGAGKAPTAKTHFMYAADNLSAYSVFGHRHTGELLEQLCLNPEQIQFTPHLLPIPRGILATIYLRLKSPAKTEEIESLFREFYKGSPLVRLHATPQLPQIQHVVSTNFCDLGFALGPDGKRLIVVSCLDNLLKGAAGQAVQNMNLMCGWKEEEGLL
ncbi:N-acetyl-gamma-glutamyl-phosphate reductase [Edaphobacter sp. 12200R-103]|uniref:N-acetyl-gamma-glutamyl-phosphate reductase n=1 Tax=Edaphobacter sp. 12200R-103 TaxID=2703788 RepID=UPI00138B3BBB|nr:N-acetyl-gamma-glutamyl-phosphate reductase [Edaphobacter sp. 12200R-103]QHS53675.1 N-acetyl-gamma-glutamyl-phosphate reductase [Edaphobacter sp. 12200R-103]